MATTAPEPPDLDQLGSLLASAILTAGLDPYVVIADLADVFVALTDETRSAPEFRYLQLEALGATGLYPRSEVSTLVSWTKIRLARRAAIEETRVFDALRVCKGLRINPDQLRALELRRFVWGFDGVAGMRYPSWQFKIDDGAPFARVHEDLHIVVDAIPEDALPSMIARIMWGEEPGLPTLTGEVLSPHEYLCAGENPWLSLNSYVAP
jgi:hypothetical protein